MISAGIDVDRKASSYYNFFFTMHNTLHSFLKNSLKGDKPLLLALSGGPDSLALFYLMHKLKIEFHVAHVDHGWREESAAEALVLQKLAGKHECPFHVRKLDPKMAVGNLEEYCRNERLRFFRELNEKHSFQAVVLGHHADDLAETILKRMLEAGSLATMEEMSFHSELVLWRPLLNVRKKEILSWLEKEGVEAFFDRTNIDEKFLRARMRTKIIPKLSEDFGKDVTSALLKLGRDSCEIERYLERRTSHFWNTLIEGPFGDCLDFCEINERVEMIFLIKKMAKKRGALLTQPILNDLLDWLSSGVANKKIVVKNFEWGVDRKKLFIYLPNVEGRWERGVGIGTTNWVGVWKGEMSAYLPNDFELCAPDVKKIYPKNKKTLDEWWSKHKIPALLRSLAPIVIKDEKVVHEFLTGVIEENKNSLLTFVWISNCNQ